MSLLEMVFACSSGDELLLMKDERGFTLLHLLINGLSTTLTTSLSRSLTELISHLVFRCPKICVTTDSETRTPLSKLVDTLTRTPLRTVALKVTLVQLLLAAAPDSASIVNRDGLHPLHELVEKRIQSGSEKIMIEEHQCMAVQALVNAFPAASKIASRRNGLPLHSAISHRCCARLCAVLLSANPMALLQDRNGEPCSFDSPPAGTVRRDCAIHVACKESPGHLYWVKCQWSDPTVISLLLSADPRQAALLGADGRSPLYLVLTNAKNTRVGSADCTACLGLLLKHCPDEMRQELHAPGLGGALPLHVACTYGMDIGAIQTLLDVDPEAVSREFTDNGEPQLALEAAIRHGAPPAVLRALCSAYQAAVSHVGSEGRLPLHHAMLHRCELAVVLALAGAGVKVTVQSVRSAKAGTSKTQPKGMLAVKTPASVSCFP